jgi:hypothetical protein
MHSTGASALVRFSQAVAKVRLAYTFTTNFLFARDQIIPSSVSSPSSNLSAKTHDSPAQQEQTMTSTNSAAAGAKEEFDDSATGPNATHNAARETFQYPRTPRVDLTTEEGLDEGFRWFRGFLDARARFRARGGGIQPDDQSYSLSTRPVLDVEETQRREGVRREARAMASHLLRAQRMSGHETNWDHLIEEMARSRAQARQIQLDERHFATFRPSLTIGDAERRTRRLRRERMMGAYEALFPSSLYDPTTATQDIVASMPRITIPSTTSTLNAPNDDYAEESMTVEQKHLAQQMASDCRVCKDHISVGYATGCGHVACVECIVR